MVYKKKIHLVTTKTPHRISFAEVVQIYHIIIKNLEGVLLIAQ